MKQPVILTGSRLDRSWLAAACDGDPAHRCLGRNAPARLQRALKQADTLGLTAPPLHDIRARDLAGR